MKIITCGHKIFMSYSHSIKVQAKVLPICESPATNFLALP